MDNTKSLNKFEAVGLMIVVIINQIILNIASYIVSRTGSSSWINIIYIAILCILFFILIQKLFKPFNSLDLLDVSKFLGGSFLKTIIGLFYILFFILFAAISLRHISSSLNLIYFEDSPLIFVMLFFLVPACIVSRFGIKSIARLNIIFMSVFFISMLVILFSTIDSFVPQRLFPILGYGAYKTFVEGFVNISSFTCISYLYFIIPFLEKENEFKKIGISSIIVSSIYIFFSVIYLLMLFPFISFSDEMLSIYLVARLIEYGRFFQRIDALFVFVWILTILSFLSITIFLICHIFKKISNIKENKIICFPFSLIILSISLLFQNISQVKYIENNIFGYIVIFLSFILSPTVLFFGYLKKINENRRKIKI